MELLSERKTKDDKINALEVQNDILNMEGSLLRQRQQRKSTNKIENKMVTKKLEEVAEILDMHPVLARRQSEVNLSSTEVSPVPTIKPCESTISDTEECMDTRVNSVLTLKSDETDHNNVIQQTNIEKLVQMQENMQQDNLMQQTTIESLVQMQLKTQATIGKLVLLQEKMQQDIAQLSEKVHQNIEQMNEKMQQDLNDLKYMLSNSEL